MHLPLDEKFHGVQGVNMHDQASSYSGNTWMSGRHEEYT
jgi:hypothetical protein